MASQQVSVNLTITNLKAIKALKVVLRTLKSVESDMPWRDDVKNARKALRYAVKHLELKDRKQ